MLQRHRAKVEHDYDEMVNMKSSIENNKRPRKKYRTSNCFVDTRLSYLFPLDGLTREEAIAQAVTSMTTHREGLFVLLTNRPLTASRTLEIRCQCRVNFNQKRRSKINHPSVDYRTGIGRCGRKWNGRKCGNGIGEESRSLI